MSSKKLKKEKGGKKGKVEKKNTLIDLENENWEELLKESKINDPEIKYSCAICVLVESDAKQIAHTKLFCEAAIDGLRKSIKVISKSEMMRKISLADSFKVEPNPPKYFQVCKKALDIMNGGDQISTELWIQLIKFQILIFKEEYIIQRQREELDKLEKAQRELNKMNLEESQKGKGKKKKDSKKSSKKSEKASGKSKKGKSSGKDTEVREIYEKPDSKIRKKGDEWKDIPFIDDAPKDGPEMYIFLIGFHDPHLPKEFASAGIPLFCYIKVFSQLSMAKSEEKPKITYSKSLTDLRKSTEEKNKKTKSKVQIPVIEVTETDRIAISEFWQEMKKIDKNINDFPNLKNVPVVPYELPDLPSDSQKYSDHGKIMYDQLSFLSYDIHGLKKQHSNYLDKMKVWLANINDTIEDVEMSKYKILVDKIPTEFATVPIIMQCMLEQVKDNCEPKESIIPPINTPQSIEEKDPLNIMKDRLYALNLEYGIINLPKPQIYVNKPYIISFGDDILMKTYKYNEGQIDFSLMTHNLLECNPIYKLWSQHPELDEYEKELYVYHIKKLMEFIYDECLDYHVISHVLCLLKFEEMLEEISEFYSKKNKVINPCYPEIPTYIITAGCGSQFITLQHVENITSCSQKLGNKVINFMESQSNDFLIGTVKKTSITNTSESSSTSSSEDDVCYLKENNVEFNGSNNLADTENITVTEKISMHKYVPTFKKQSENILFYCNEITNLLRDKNFHNLFNYTKYYGYIEQLNEQVLAQVLYSCFSTYSKFDYVYFTLCDVLLVLFYNPQNEEKVFQENWSAKLSSPVNFRDFYEHVLFEEIDWLEKENKNFVESILTPEKEEISEEEKILLMKDDLNINPENVFGADYLIKENEYILEGTLKHKDILKLKEAEVSETLESQKKKGKKSAKDKGSGKTKKKMKEKTVPEIISEPNEKEHKKMSINKNIEPNTERKSSATKALTKEGKKENASSEKVLDILTEEENDDNENLLQGYDLGTERVQFFGDDTKFISPNGSTIVSVKLTCPFRKEKLLAVAVEEKKNTLFYYTKLKDDDVKIVKEESCEGDTPPQLPLFHLILEGGVVVVFSPAENTITDLGISKPQPKMTDTENKKEKGKETKTADTKGNKRESIRLSVTAGGTSDGSKTKRKPRILPSSASTRNTEIEKESEMEKLSEKEKPSNEIHNPGFDFKLSLPSGLIVENKNGTGSLSPFYIKQQYKYKGVTCHSVAEEDCRLYLRNGNIMKFMTNGEVIIFYPNGMVYICKEFEMKHSAEENTEITEATKIPVDEKKEIFSASVTNYTTIFPSGKQYETKNGTVSELSPYIFQYATDLEENQIFMHRGDGTNSLLLSNGTLIVNYPDKTCTSTSLHVVENDFLTDLVWEKEDYECESNIEKMILNMENEEIYFIRQELIGNQVVEDAYVTIHLNFDMEHPHYASVYFEGHHHHQGKVTIPQNTSIEILPEGMYNMNIKDEVKLNVTTSFATLSRENAISTVYFRESEKDDGQGNIFTINLDGNTSIKRNIGRDTVEMKMTSKMRLLLMRRDYTGAEFHNRKLILEYLEEAKRNLNASVTQYPESSSENDPGQFSPFFSIFTPLTDLEKESWLVIVKNTIDSYLLKRQNIIRSTYGCGYNNDLFDEDDNCTTTSWFHPLPIVSSKINESKNSDELIYCKQCYPTEHTEDLHAIPEALCLWVFRKLGSLGIPRGRLSLAHILVTAFHWYMISAIRMESLYANNIMDIMENDIPIRESLIKNAEKKDSKIANEKSWFVNINNCSWDLDAKKTYFQGLEVQVVPKPPARSKNQKEYLRRLSNLKKAKEKENENKLKLREQFIKPY